MQTKLGASRLPHVHRIVSIQKLICRNDPRTQLIFSAPTASTSVVQLLPDPIDQTISSMNDTLFSFSANIFGFVVGGISLLGVIVAVCRPHLPSNKIKTLEALLHETEDDFEEAVEAGLLVPEFVEKTEENLTG